MCKIISMSVLFGSSGIDITVCTQSDMSVHICLCVGVCIHTEIHTHTHTHTHVLHNLGKLVGKKKLKIGQQGTPRAKQIFSSCRSFVSHAS
jgi:hypothetical protein